MTSFEMMNLFLSRAQSRHREADEVSSESAFEALTADALENEQHAQVYALASIAESLAILAETAQMQQVALASSPIPAETRN